MSEQFDPQASDDYLYPQAIKCCEVHRSCFLRAGKEWGLSMAGFFTTTVCRPVAWGI